MLDRLSHTLQNSMLKTHDSNYRSHKTEIKKKNSEAKLKYCCFYLTVMVGRSRSC